MITSGQTFTGKVGVAFNATPTATGSISLWRAILPAGLSLNSSTGAITGTPEKVGSFTSLFTDKAFAKGVLNGGTSSSQGFYYHALKSDGTVVGWGSDSTGASVPAGLTDVVEISRSLALKKDGTVVGIGYGVAPSGLTNVAALGNNLVLKKDGTLFAWGDNTYVPTGSDFVAVGSGNTWNVALKYNGTVVGWGQYNSGLLDTTGISGVTSIAAGANFYLTLHEDGSVFSRAGSNTPDDIWSYTPSATRPKAIAIAAGTNRSLILLEDGTVYRYGDVGYPATSGIVQGLSGVVAIGANSSFSAVKNDGSVVRWGESLTQNTPVSVIGVSASPFSLSSSVPVLFQFTAGVPIIILGQIFSGSVGVSFNRGAAITDSVNRPVTGWSATGLPAWASLNASTGAITGTPPSLQSVTITLTATGPGGSDSETAVISISQAAPIITSAQSFTGKAGLAFNAQITTQDSANRPVTSWSATGLPLGLSIYNDGIVNGYPSQAGAFTALLTATGPAGSDTRTVSFSIAIGAPLISGNQIFSGQIGVNFDETVTAENTTNQPVTSWSASGLPSWANFNTSTAVISGVPTSDANTIVTMTATGPGGTSSREVTINIDSLQGGTIVIGRSVTRVGDWSPSDLATNGTQVSGFGYRWRTEPFASGDSGTIPPGMSITPSNNSRANIAGTPTTLGRYKGLAVFEYDENLRDYQPVGNDDFDIKVIGLPQINLAQIYPGIIGESFSATAQATDLTYRPVTSWAATGLPAWAAISASGNITGTPTANGSFPFTLVAMGPAGTVTQSATIVISSGAPIILPGQNLTGKVGVPFSGTVALTNAAGRPATSWAAIRLPAGLQINNSGQIIGTPTVFKNEIASVTATGPGGSSAETPVNFTISAGTPIITSGQTASGTVGSAFSKTFLLTDSTNRPVTSWAATGLPAGLSINATTGAITGTPQSAGSATITLTATGPGGSDSETVVISIAEPFSPPIINAGQSFSGTVGLAFNAQIATQDSANRPVTSWSATGLPEGLSIDPTTGEIAGTSQDSGSKTITLTATGPGGSDTETATISLALGHPIIVSGQSFTGKVGVAFSIFLDIEDAEDRPATSFLNLNYAFPLPSGLLLNENTGEISGTPTSKGSFTVYVGAVNSAGGSPGASVLFTIAEGSPVFNYASTNNLRLNQGVSLNPTVTDLVNRPITSWSATGLPSGLIINSATGAITGTPTVEGSSTATITATGPGGIGAQSVYFSILSAIPIFAGSIRAISIHAGATAAKALYYGAKKIWPTKYHEILESLATINPADGSRGHSKFLDAGLNLAASNLSRIGFKFGPAVRIKNATITTTAGTYTLGVATNWTIVRYFATHDLTITTDGIGRSGVGNIGNGWDADVCGFWVDIPASSLTASDKITVDYEYIGAYAAKHGVSFWNATTTSGGTVESYLGTWDNTPLVRMPTTSELPRIIVTAQASLLSNTLCRRRVIIQNNP